MENKFVIRNQDNLYLAKNKEEWVTGEEPAQVLGLKHHDEALNTLIEKNAKEIMMRGEIIEVPVNEKNRPIVEVLANQPVEAEPESDDVQEELLETASEEDVVDVVAETSVESNEDETVSS